MPTLINDCVFLGSWTNWADAPESGRQWTTKISGVVDSAEQRQGLQAAAFRSQSGRLTARTLLKRHGMEEEIVAALISGRALAARIGWGSAVIAGTTTTVDIADTVPIAALSYVVLRVVGVAYARQVSAIATPSAGVRRLTVAVLPTAPAVGDRVWPALMGTPSVSRIRALDGAGWDLQLSLAEPLGEGSVGNSDSCTPASLVNTGAGLNLCGSPSDLAADLDVECGLVAATLRWSEVFAANAYNVKRSTTSLGARTTVAQVLGDVFSYDVPRSSTAYYYVVTAVTGASESNESDEILVPATTIEGVMRAVQERWLATEDATYTGPLSPIVWPDRISDSASPGDYPTDGFYTDATVAANAVVYVKAINDAFLDAWLENYATTGDWTDLGTVAAIPRWTRLGLEIPASSTITTGNWLDRLLDLAGQTCQLEHLVRQADLVEQDQRDGLGSGTHWDQVSDTRGELGYGSYLGAAQSAWAAAGWPTEGGAGSAVVDVEDLPPIVAGGGPAVAISAPGLDAEVGSYGASYLSAWTIELFSWRAKVEADLSNASLGTARVYLRLTSQGDSLPRPVAVTGSLQPWLSLAPGSVVQTAFLSGTTGPPPPPDGAGTTFLAKNEHHAGPPFAMLSNVKEWWQCDEQVVCWTRSHDATLGHWTHYP